MAEETALADAALTIRLLGPVDIRVGDAPLSVDTRKATALLAYLAVTGRPAAREELAALLWPDAGPEAARGALRRTLSVLKAALRGGALSIQRSTVALEVRGEDVDLRTFHARLAQVRAHGHGTDEACDECLGALEAALALDRGEFMAGFSLRDSDSFEEWHLAESEAYRRDRSGALERLARARAAAGTWDLALAAGRRWLALDPLHEPAHRLVMLALARSGEPAAAGQQFHECVRILDAELGVAPLQATIDLYEEIRAGRIEPDHLEALATGATPTREAEHAERRIRATGIVGRERELHELLTAHDAIGPDGRFLVIEGEPGIGKTRLATAFIDAVRARGGLVLGGRAFAGEETIAFAAIGALLRAGLEQDDAAQRLAALSPDVRMAADELVPLGSLVPGSRMRSGAGPEREARANPFARARLVEGLAETLTALAAGPTPGILFIDDLDWADASTVEVITYLVHRLAGRPLAVLATWRPLDPTDAERQHLLATAAREALLVHLVLGRLTRASVASLVAASFGDRATEHLIDDVFAESEGLPLYLVEALATDPFTTGGIPRNMVTVLRGRLLSVSELAGQVLGTGSAIGRSFAFETVRAASGRSEDETLRALEELVRRGILAETGVRGGDVRFDFTHGRLRDVAYEELGLSRRRVLHRRIAEALRMAAAPTEGDWSVRWSRIAYHEQQAGRFAEAAEAHRRAGAEARRVFANAEARAHFDSALALGHPESAEIHEQLGEILTLLGDYVGAIAHLEAAAAIGDPARSSTVEHRLALVYARQADWGRAATHAAAALAATPEEDQLRRSELLADRSAIAGRGGDPGMAEALARAALDIAEAVGDRTAIARACQVLGGLARERGELKIARSLLERALEASVDATDPGLRIAALNTLALVESASGDGERASVHLLEALERCEKLGDRHRQAALENNLADLLRAAGRRDEAMLHLKRAVSIFADVGGGPGALDPAIWKLVDW